MVLTPDPNAEGRVYTFTEVEDVEYATELLHNLGIEGGTFVAGNLEIADDTGKRAAQLQLLAETFGVEMGVTAALTFDFHNTVALCDGWLDLEIRTLGSAALRYISENAPDRCARNLMTGADAAAWLEEADARYADLRAEARDSGREISAIAAVTRIVNDELGVGAPSDLIDEAVVALMRDCLAEVQPVPGVLDALATLDATQPMAVVSSAAYPPFVDWALDKLGLHRYFPIIITSAGSGYYKTDPRIYLSAVNQLQRRNPAIKPANVAHIGDSLRFDVAGAQAAGLRTIWYNADGHGAKGRNASAGTAPDVEIASMKELPAAVARLAVGLAVQQGGPLLAPTRWWRIAPSHDIDVILTLPALYASAWNAP